LPIGRGKKEKEKKEHHVKKCNCEEVWSLRGSLLWKRRRKSIT
jgi:hypothetical protein